MGAVRMKRPAKPFEGLGGTLKEQVVPVRSESEPERALKLPVSLRVAGHPAGIRTRGRVGNGNGVAKGCRSSIRVQKRRECGGVHGIEAYTQVAGRSASRVVILRVVEQVKGVNANLQFKTLSEADKPRQGQVHSGYPRPQAIANRRVPDCSQLEAVQGIAVRVDPLELVAKVAAAALSGHEVWPVRAVSLTYA